MKNSEPKGKYGHILIGSLLTVIRLFHQTPFGIVFMASRIYDALKQLESIFLSHYGLANINCSSLSDAIDSYVFIFSQ